MEDGRELRVAEKDKTPEYQEKNAIILPFCQSVAETGGRKQFGTVFDYKIVQGCATNGSPVGLTNSGAKGTNNGSKATNSGSPTAHVSATNHHS